MFALPSSFSFPFSRRATREASACKSARHFSFTRPVVCHHYWSPAP